MKKLITAVCIFYACFTLAYGQDLNNINTFTPDQSSQSNTTNYTTDYYTGHLNYTVPLSTIDIYGIKFPTILSYNGGGNKVQDISGATGLGWSVSLGGQITRSINGLPDEGQYGYCGSQRTGGANYAAMSKTYIQNITNGTYDSQPDQFNFSFLGFQGTFVLDPDGNPLLQSNETGLKVILSPFKRGTTSTGTFILEDQKGNQYYFNGINTVTCVSHGETTNTTQTYVAGWYLTKIITFSAQEIDLTYSLDNIQYTNYLDVRHVDNGTISCLGSQHQADYTYNENQDMTTQQVNLTSISGNGITINLGYNLSRTDITNSHALTDMSISYNSASPVQYKLNYGYFTSNDGTNTQRLKLSSISQVFAGGVTKTPYSFIYNEAVNLPARNSIKTDMLGFYNNNATSSDLSTYGDKTPNLINSQADILQSVTNLLGGTVNFEYELNNDGFNAGLAYPNPAPNDCGLRIKDVFETRSATDPTIINKTTYNYNTPGSTLSSGQLFLYNPIWDYQVKCSTSNPASVQYYSSAPFQALTDANGAIVGYSNVTVTRADGSSTLYTFTNYNTYPNLASWQFYEDYQSSATFAPSSEQALDFLQLGADAGDPGTSYAFARGKLLTESLINTSGQTVKTTSYGYALSPSTGTVIGISSRLSEIDSYDHYNQYRIFGFTYSTQDLRLVSKTVQNFRAGVAQQNTTENYTYTTYAPNLLRSRTLSGSGVKTDNYYLRYPFDVIPSIPTSPPYPGLVLTSMTYNNMISTPVEVVHSVTRNAQETVVSANVTEYGGYNPTEYGPYILTYLPSQEFKFENTYPLPISSYTNYNVSYAGNIETNNLDSRIKSFRNYNSYDAENNLTQSESPSGTKNYTADLYGYNNSYKVAEDVGAQLNDIAYTSFEMNDQGNWSYSGTPDFDISAVTGTNTYNLSKGNLSKGLLTSTTSYILSYWTKNSNYFSVSGTVGTPVLLANRNGWYCYMHTIAGQSSVTISGSGTIDEVRLYPAGTKMTTSTCIPFVGISSSDDENSQLIYYNYDEFNRLQYVRDNEKNIIKAYCYNNVTDGGNCFISFSSAAKSGSFYKNNCGPGYIGSQAITYNVEAGRYSASTQQAADGLAQNDVNQNGQVYANANGSCMVAPTITNVSYGGHDNYVNIAFSSVSGCGTAVINWMDLTTNTSYSSAGACTSPLNLDILTDHHNYSFTVSYYPLNYTTVAYTFNANY